MDSILEVARACMWGHPLEFALAVCKRDMKRYSLVFLQDESRNYVFHVGAMDEETGCIFDGIGAYASMDDFVFEHATEIIDITVIQVDPSMLLNDANDIKEKMSPVVVRLGISGYGLDSIDRESIEDPMVQDHVKRVLSSLRFDDMEMVGAELPKWRTLIPGALASASIFAFTACHSDDQYRLNTFKDLIDAGFAPIGEATSGDSGRTVLMAAIINDFEPLYKAILARDINPALVDLADEDEMTAQDYAAQFPNSKVGQAYVQDFCSA